MRLYPATRALALALFVLLTLSTCTSLKIVDGPLCSQLRAASSDGYEQVAKSEGFTEVGKGFDPASGDLQAKNEELCGARLTALTASASPTPTAATAPTATATLAATASPTAAASPSPSATATASPTPPPTTAPPAQTTAPPAQTTAPPAQTTAPPVQTTAPPPTPSPTPTPVPEIARPQVPSSGLAIHGRVLAADGSPIGGACVTVGPPIRCWTFTSRTADPSNTGYFVINLSEVSAPPGLYDFYVVVKPYTAYTYANYYSGTFTVSGVVEKNVRFQ